MAANQAGVDYLIQVAKEPSRGSAVQLAALDSLGYAGGQDAVDYLISVVKDAPKGSAVQLAALKALGRASRE